MPRSLPVTLAIRPSMLAALLMLGAVACASAQAPSVASAPASSAAPAPTPNVLEQRAAVAATKPDSVVGVDWLFAWVDGFSGNTAELIPLPGFILTPEARKLSGNSSCNRFSAGYLLDAENGRLSFTNLVNTRMMCQRANAEAENAILAALLATDGYRLQGGTLELLSKGRTVARLVAK